MIYCNTCLIFAVNDMKKLDTLLIFVTFLLFLGLWFACNIWHYMCTYILWLWVFIDWLVLNIASQYDKWVPSALCGLVTARASVATQEIRFGRKMDKIAKFSILDKKQNSQFRTKFGRKMANWSAWSPKKLSNSFTQADTSLRSVSSCPCLLSPLRGSVSVLAHAGPCCARPCVHSCKPRQRYRRTELFCNIRFIGITITLLQLCWKNGCLELLGCEWINFLSQKSECIELLGPHRDNNHSGYTSI